jgi:hypothetical protein
MPTARSRQLSEKLDNRALLRLRVTNKFQAAVHRPDPRNPRHQFNGLVLMVQENNPLAARYDVIRKVELHPLDADVCAPACQCPPGYGELSGKINREPWVSILESLHRLCILAERWLDHTL